MTDGEMDVILPVCLQGWGGGGGGLCVCVHPGDIH